MNSRSTLSGGKSGSEGVGNKRGEGDCAATDCCHIDIHIECHGDVHIHNCGGPGPTGKPPTPPSCPPTSPSGTCIPSVAGAKHKLSRAHKLDKLAGRVRVPSALATSTIHMARRFVLGKAAANPLETAAFAILARMPDSILSCAVSAYDSLPPAQRDRLFVRSLDPDPDEATDSGTLTAALASEIKQRAGVLVFGDSEAADEERPGSIRVYTPQGEDFFSQVRICRVNDLRTANYIPSVSEGDYLPAEIQQDCAPQLVNGQPQVVCEVRNANCPGFSFSDGVCLRVPDVATGDAMILQGVNFFSVDAKVRLTDKQTGTLVRDVEAHVWGDVDTPVTEVVNGASALVNDCRVHDQLTFRVPDDLPPAIYQIQVVVPNITGIPAFGEELFSNSEYINVVPPVTARFQIATDKIYARKETSPDWLGSDEVGLHTLAVPWFLDGSLGLPPQEQKYQDIQGVDFDTGTARNITRTVFTHDQPILGMCISVMGYEIDSQRAYDKEITEWTDYFVDLVKQQAAYIGAAVAALGGVGALTSLGWTGALLAAIAAIITLGIDLIIALWAPADPIIQDSIGLSATELAALTSANSPAPPAVSYETAHGIEVRVNETVPPVKIPLQYTETREYVSDDQDSRYEMTYRFNRVA